MAVAPNATMCVKARSSPSAHGGVGLSGLDLAACYLSPEACHAELINNALTDFYTNEQSEQTHIYQNCIACRQEPEHASQNTNLGAAFPIVENYLFGTQVEYNSHVTAKFLLSEEISKVQSMGSLPNIENLISAVANGRMYKD